MPWFHTVGQCTVEQWRQIPNSTQYSWCQHVIMYYSSGTGRRCCIVSGNVYIHCVCIHHVAAPFCMKRHHSRHHESVMSHRISDSANQCIFIPTKFVRMEPYAFLEDGHPNNKNIKKKNEMSSDMRSGPDLTIHGARTWFPHSSM